MKKYITRTIIAFSYFFCFGIFNLANAFDLSSQNSYVTELKPIQNSFQLAKATFLPDYGNDLKMSDYDTIDNDYNSSACRDYPHSSCPAGARCEPCPFDATKYKVNSCQSPYILSNNTCTCPASVSLNNQNDVCIKYCGSTCIDKTCTPSINKTSCTNGFKDCDNGCGQNTRKCCVACTDKVITKPENSSFVYANCIDDNGSKQIKTDWVCNEGYEKSENTCIKKEECPNSEYKLTMCPYDGNCSSCTASSGKKYYKLDSCNSGYSPLDGSYCQPNNCNVQYGPGFYVKENCPSGQIEELNMCGKLGQSSTVCCKCVSSNNCSAQCSQIYGTSNDCYARCIPLCTQSGTAPNRIVINGKICSIR